MHKWRLGYAISAILLSLLSSLANAKLPSISFTALTDPYLMIPKNEVGFIPYKIKNTSNKTYHLILQETTGITQVLNAKNSCEEGLINLEPGKSCILGLQVRTHETSASNNLGPSLCDYDQEHLTQGECFTPSKEEKIRIKRLEANHAAYSIEVKLPQEVNHKESTEERFKRCFGSFASCSITLFVDSQAGGVVKITNTGKTVIPKLQAYNLPVGVTAVPNPCTNIAANGGTCTMNFKPGSTHAANPVQVRIAPTEKPQPTDGIISMQVLAVGDLYAGNKLFQLPFTSLNPSANYYTALATDASPQPVFGFDTASYCTGGSIVPPIAALRALRMASNCVSNGPIGGFQCTGSTYYWSSTVAPNGEAYVVEFATGMETTRATDAPSYLRCVRGYVLS